MTKAFQFLIFSMILLGVGVLFGLLYVAESNRQSDKKKVAILEKYYIPGTQYLISGGIFTVLSGNSNESITLVSSTGQSITVPKELLNNPVKLNPEGTTK